MVTHLILLYTSFHKQNSKFPFHKVIQVFREHLRNPNSLFSNQENLEVKTTRCQNIFDFFAYHTLYIPIHKRSSNISEELEDEDQIQKPSIDAGEEPSVKYLTLLASELQKYQQRSFSEDTLNNISDTKQESWATTDQIDFRLLFEDTQDFAEFCLTHLKEGKLIECCFPYSISKRAYTDRINRKIVEKDLKLLLEYFLSLNDQFSENLKRDIFSMLKEDLYLNNYFGCRTIFW